MSKNGVLAYRAGELQGRRLVWFDRNGKETPAIDEPGDYRDTWLSPDGKRVAFDGSGPSTAGDIWIRDLVRRVTTRFTFDPAVERDPVWSPDSRQIVFTSAVKGRGDLYLKDASATKEAELLFASPDVKLASDWSRDGSYLLFSTQSAETGWDSYALPMKGTNRTPVALLKTKFDELFPTFSPDGHYIVYSSKESGRSEVYAQEFPDARTKSQISTDGGGQPVLERRRQGDFLSQPHAADGRARSDQLNALDWRSDRTVPGSVRGGHREGALPSGPGREAVSRDCRARSRCGQAGVRRPELDGRATEVAADGQLLDNSPS